jgi:hypothetical protein
VFSILKDLILAFHVCRSDLISEIDCTVDFHSRVTRSYFKSIGWIEIHPKRKQEGEEEKKKEEEKKNSHYTITEATAQLKQSSPSP